MDSQGATAAVVPLADMFNHNPQDANDYFYDPSTATFKVIAGADIKEGEQVLLDSMVDAFGLCCPAHKIFSWFSGVHCVWGTP